MSERETKPGESPSQLDTLEHAEGKLWRVSMWLLALLALALVAASWESFRTLPQRLEALPIGVLVLTALFVLFAWSKRKEVSELRAFIRRLESAEPAPLDPRQAERLTALLSRSQQGYRDLIDSFEHAVFSLDLDGRMLAGNRALAEILSAPIAAIVGRNLSEFILEPRIEDVAACVSRFREQRYWSGVVRIRLSHGNSPRFFQCVLYAIARDGEVVGASGLARDVTAQQAEETRFSELFATLQEGIYFSTPEGRLLDVNPALLRILGYDSKEELCRVNVRDLYFDPAERGRLLAELDSSQTLSNREITLRRKDGSPVVCLDTSTAIRDASGRVVRYQGTLVDVTESREMERRLQRQQEFARSLVESFPDLIVVLDTAGRYTYVSSRVTELLGYSQDELLGQRLGERTRPEDRPGMMELYEQLLTGRRRHGTIEYQTMTKQGQWRAFRASASPLFDARGKIIGVVASARDVTELKRLEQQVLQTEKLAAMGQMIAGVAHELNNPLTAILGVSDLLRERVEDESSRRQLDLVHQQARRAAHIVQNLLAYSRPPTLNKTLVNLADLAERTVRLQEYSLRSGEITVQFEHGDGLALVEGDPNQLTQVLLNLLINAEQAIRSIRERGIIRVRVGESQGTVTLLVEDDGPGIAPDAMPKIFDPFFTTKRPGRGTGLGLSICLAVVKEHGGKIEAENRAEGGARFTIYLPTTRPSSSRSSPLASGSAATGIEGAAVLVVDDEESIRELAAKGLASKGVTVECVGSADEALARLEDSRFDAIVCDWNLPGLNGREFLDRVQSRAELAPMALLLTTGDLVEPETLEDLERRGILLLQKPFRIAQLAASLGWALDSVRSRIS